MLSFAAASPCSPPLLRPFLPETESQMRVLICSSWILALSSIDYPCALPSNSASLAEPFGDFTISPLPPLEHHSVSLISETDAYQWSEGQRSRLGRSEEH